MKVYIPYRRVEAPELTDEQIRKLLDGRYVEGEFGLEEGDAFVLDSGRTALNIVCYRTLDSQRVRLRCIRSRFIPLKNIGRL